MAFKLSVISRESGIVHVAAYGEATARDFPAHNQIHFDAILGPTWASQRVALDMDAVPYIDSSAIGWLIHIQKSFRENEGTLVLHSVQPHVRNILALLKIERVVPIAEDATGVKKLLSKKSRVQQSAK